ncbi:hypothetical protein CB1_069740015 [Camelus ferus]|nr:hypothetical protein CB1_069740015 [Camelus ferus]
MLCRTASDGTRCPKSPAQSVEAQGITATALSPEETKEFLPSEQGPPQDTKKDKAQWRPQQGWLRTMINFFLGSGPEEPKEKASKKEKGKEGLPPTETPEALGEPAPRKKSQKKASRKKYSHKKHGAEETKAAQDQEAGGQEANMAAASHCEQADLGPAAGGEEVSDLHQSLLLKGRGAGIREVSSEATVHQWEEELKKPDKDAIIQKIVELLQRVGDQWEEEQRQTPQPEVALQNPALVFQKKSQEKKSSLKRAFSLKKYGSEEPKRAGAADVSSTESRPPKRPSFLPMCVGGHRLSSSSSPEEFIQKIIALLQDAEEQGGDKIRRHPSFKKFFYKLSDSSLRKLLATLRSQETPSTESDRNLTKSPYPFVFGLANKCPGSNCNVALSLVGLHYRQPSYSQFPYGEAKQEGSRKTTGKLGGCLDKKAPARGKQDPLDR